MTLQVQMTPAEAETMELALGLWLDANKGAIDPEHGCSDLNEEEVSRYKSEISRTESLLARFK